MSRYLILKFEHDDEFGMFPDDLGVMLEEISNPPYAVKIVGEVVADFCTNDTLGETVYRIVRWEANSTKVTPIGSTGGTEV